MKIDFDQAIIDPATGAPLMEGEVTLTLWRVVALALNQAKPGILPAESLQRGRLAISVMKGGVLDISPEDTSLARASLAGCWAPVVHVQAHDMLDAQG